MTCFLIFYESLALLKLELYVILSDKVRRRLFRLFYQLKRSVRCYSEQLNRFFNRMIYSVFNFIILSCKNRNRKNNDEQTWSLE